MQFVESARGRGEQPDLRGPKRLIELGTIPCNPVLSPHPAKLQLDFISISDQKISSQEIGMAGMASCRVYNSLAKFVGHVEQEGGYYNIYRGWADFAGWVEQEGGYFTVYQAGIECVGRVRQEGQYYKVYRRWTHFVGHLRREGGQYKVYKEWTDLVGSVELENTVQVAPLLLSGGAALRLLL